ncbi:protein translocase subunit SecF [Candidatus Uhrbacteria bacterium]|nr:protein translocase subunit SecF [Candidatus Uhrbacteria bacterium]
MKLQVIKNRNYWFFLSGFLVVASLVLIVYPGLKYGVDFTGGSLIEIKFDQPVSVGAMKQTFDDAGYKDATIQTSGENGFLIRTQMLSEDEHQSVLGAIKTAHGNLTELSFESVGPVIGSELRRTATIGVILTLILIGLYVAWAFRKVSEPVASWKYATITVLTAFHDVVIMIGAFALFGVWFGWEVGAAIIAAALTVLGYSINDTIVVFDRTRENLLRRTAHTLSETVEMSIEQTLLRSLNTSLTTILALIAIFIFGGDSTQPFALALIIGITVGTYSSIFLASPLLVVWEKMKKRS